MKKLLVVSGLSLIALGISFSLLFFQNDNKTVKDADGIFDNVYNNTVQAQYSFD